MKCKKCSAPIQSRYCTQCGCDNGPVEEQKRREENRQNRSMGKLILCLVILVPVVIFGLFMSLKTGPSVERPEYDAFRDPLDNRLLVETAESSGSSQDSFLGTDLKREQIRTVTFHWNYDEFPEGGTPMAWDVSQNQDGSVWLWTDWNFDSSDKDIDFVNAHIGGSGGVSSENCQYLFRNCVNLKSIDNMHDFHSEKARSMASMFENCASLERLLVNLDMTSVTDVSNMFSGCTSLESCSWMGEEATASQVTTMAGMFRGCAALESVNLSHMDTSAVTDMTEMFFGCQSLWGAGLDKNFSTERVTSMSGMFFGCASLHGVDLGGFETSRLQDMSYMFANSGLNAIDLTAWNTAAVEDMSYAFQGCTGLLTADLSHFENNVLGTTQAMFADCRALREVTLKDFNTAQVTNMSAMFMNCESLDYVAVNDFDTAKVTDMSHMFSGCRNLKVLDLTAMNTAQVTDMGGMFASCTSLKDLYLGYWEVNSVVNYQGFMDEGALFDNRPWSILFP